MATPQIEADLKLYFIQEVLLGCIETMQWMEGVRK